MPRTPAKTLTRWQRVNNTSPAKDKLWQSMRIMRTGFSAAELATVSEVGATNAAKYLRALRKAGFVRQTSEHTPGQAGTADRFALVRNTGPLSPIQHKRGGVFDRNTGTRWGADGRPVADTALAEDAEE
ncbi:hypothetical protein ACG04Q_11905 [Roseateles sp. DXS20W]|uniref:Uncharacterized protein n=1 Tax=Pelomonas lactea TaxID=3299030 RepID=A0ABW7GJZ0_9BURK